MIPADGWYWVTSEVIDYQDDEDELDLVVQPVIGFGKHTDGEIRPIVVDDDGEILLTRHGFLVHEKQLDEEAIEHLDSKRFSVGDLLVKAADEYLATLDDDEVSARVALDRCFLKRES
jgi:hypothetical protein